MLLRNKSYFQRIYVSTLLFLMLKFALFVQVAYGKGIEDSHNGVPLKIPKNLEKTGHKDPWIGRDKIQHFFVSAFITSFGFLIMYEPLNSSENNSLSVGSGISLGFGVGKELYDLKSKKGHASYKDLVADLLGIGFAVLIFKIT